MTALINSQEMLTSSLLETQRELCRYGGLSGVHNLIDQYKYRGIVSLLEKRIATTRTMAEVPLYEIFEEYSELCVSIEVLADDTFSKEQYFSLYLEELQYS